MTEAGENSELASQFGRFDRNGDGRINESEFQDLLRALGDAAPDETLSLQFAAIDADNDGIVTFDEFAAWWLDS